MKVAAEQTANERRASERYAGVFHTRAIGVLPPQLGFAGLSALGPPYKSILFALRPILFALLIALPAFA